LVLNSGPSPKTAFEDGLGATISGRPDLDYPVLCQKSGDPNREQFRDLGGWHCRRSWPTS